MPVVAEFEQSAAELEKLVEVGRLSGIPRHPETMNFRFLSRRCHRSQNRYTHAGEGGHGPERAQDREAVVPRQMQVEHDQTRVVVARAVLAQKADGRLPVGKHFERILLVVLVECLAEQADIAGVVLNNDNAGLTHRGI